MVSELIVRTGPLKGTRFVLSDDEVTIGRHSSNLFCIGDPSVSRFHCVIRMRNGAYWIADLDSNNGTLRNGLVITEECKLTDGDQITIGDSTMTFAENVTHHVETAPEPSYASTIVLSRQEAEALNASGLAAHTRAGKRTEKQLQAMLAVGGLLSCAHNMEALQCQLLETIAEVIQADAGAVVLSGSRPSDPLSTFGWSRRTGSGHCPAISQTVLKNVLREGSAVLAVELADRNDRSVAESLLVRRVQSVLCVPLLLNSKHQGALYFETVDAARQFDREDLKLVTAISGYAALALEHARRVQTLETENRYLRSQVEIRHNMIGQSQRMLEIYDRIRKCSQTDTTVLILGESGTGKELAARALHQNSSRSGKPFEAINCALLRDNLLESELFGHEKGAFTGATGLKKGKLELAQGGTVFLDEIGELAHAPQSMLLRVLQERQFTRLGGTTLLKADVRLIAATNRDLEQAVQEKEFRQDLYYRLNVVCIRMPPLRERREDIPLMAQYFLEKSAAQNKRATSGLSPAAMKILSNYAWPGNVRELQNAIEYAVVFGSTEEILPQDLPEYLFDPKSTDRASCPYHQAVRAAKEQIVLDALRSANGSYTAAANSLGIHVNNLHRLIRELNLKARVTTMENSRS